MSSKLFLFAAFVISMLLMSVNHKKKKKKVVFFGDTITEQGARFEGYIRILQNFLHEAAMDDVYELKGEGVAGDTIYNLCARVEEDVLAKGADTVIIFIGLNDMNQFTSLNGIDIDAFEAHYITIIEKLLAANIKVVLCTPAMIGEHPEFLSKEDEKIDHYSDVIRRLALQYKLPIADIRKAFINYIALINTENKEQAILSTDKVHLNNKGHHLVAEEIWKVLIQVMQ